MGALYVLIVLLCIATFLLPLTCVTVQRLRSGDIFDAQCNTCHLFNSECADGKIHLFDCCNKCACSKGATKYRDLCHPNLPVTELDCKVFVEGDEYYGLQTHQLSGPVAYIGYVKDKWYWNRKVFYKCLLDEQSTYWDTRRWTTLFSDGRSIDDFVFLNSNNGVLVKLIVGGDRWKLYIGLLIRLSITCYSYHEIPFFDTLQKFPNKISWWPGGLESSHQDYYSITSCMVIKFAGERSYYEAPSTAKPITAQKPPSAKKSVTSKKVTSTAKPTTSKKVQSTAKPTSSKKSKTTGKPATSKTLQTTAKPTTSKKLPTTRKPTTSNKSKTTAKPTTFKKLQTTVKPTTWNKLHTTRKPTASKKFPNTEKSITAKKIPSTAKTITSEVIQSTESPMTARKVPTAMSVASKELPITAKANASKVVSGTATPITVKKVHTTFTSKVISSHVIPITSKDMPTRGNTVTSHVGTTHPRNTAFSPTASSERPATSKHNSTVQHKFTLKTGTDGRCLDWLQSCGKMAEEGYCTEQKEFMESNCCRSCKAYHPGGGSHPTHSHAQPQSTTAKALTVTPKSDKVIASYTKTFKKLLEVGIPVVVVILFVVIFCCIFIMCYQRNSGKGVLPLKVPFGKENKFLDSYGSCDSSNSLLNSQEYAIIQPPSYADIHELENVEKFKKPRNAIIQPPPYDDIHELENVEKIKEPPGRLVVDYGTPRGRQIGNNGAPPVLAAPQPGQETLRRDWDGTLYMRPEQLGTL